MLSISAPMAHADQWALVTPDNEFRYRDICALIAVRGDIVNLYAFWCNHIGFSQRGAAVLNAKLDEFYTTLMKVPVHTLTRRKQGRDGELQYINRDYWQDETNELNEVHRNKIEVNVMDTWRAMQNIDKDVARTWDMNEREKTQYEAVKHKAFASVRAWLKIPTFTDRRLREERGTHKAPWRNTQMREMLRALESL